MRPPGRGGVGHGIRGELPARFADIEDGLAPFGVSHDLEHGSPGPRADLAVLNGDRKNLQL